MKKLVTIYIFLCAGMLQAQTINNTYYHPSGLIAGNVAVLEEGNDIIFSGNNDKLTLTRTDALGNYINSITFGDEPSAKHDIVRCRNEKGVVVVNRYLSVSDVIVISHFDDQLNPIWHINMPANPRNDPNPGTGYYWDLLENVDIIEHNDLFYITYSEGNPLPGLDYETTVSIICIDHAGKLQWHRNFTDPTRVAGSPQIDDLANSITLCQYGNQEALTIAGTARDQNGPLSLFFLTVDLNGGILNNFTRVGNRGLETRPDVAYDANNDYLVCTYAAGGASSNPNIYGSVGLMRLQMQGLSWVDGCIYDVALGYGDKGECITVDADGNYVVSASVIKKTGPISYIINPYLLKINSNTLYSAGAATYNMNNTKLYDNAQHSVDDNGNIYFAATMYPNLNTRLFKTDPNFVTCGYYPTGFEPTFHTLNPFQLQYNWWDPYSVYNVDIPIDDIALTYDRCEDFDEPNNYRRSSASTMTTIDITLAPSLLHSTDKLNCTINTETDGIAEVNIINMLGQHEYSNKYQLHVGSQNIEIDANLSTGMHMVRVLIDGKLQYAQKVNVVN